MEEELEKQESVSIQTEAVISEKVETQNSLESLPRIEDLRKSEQDVKVQTHIEGTTQIKEQTKVQDKVFKKKSEERKVYVKKRLKIVTSVYATVVTLLLAFVGVNIATLAILNKQVTTNTETIQSKQAQVEVMEQNPGTEIGDFQISLNEPRDYSDDKKELTWLDKITILFRNIFG